MNSTIEFAQNLRHLSLEMIAAAGASHVGSVFSSVEILSVLYNEVLDLRPQDPDWSDRDRFVLSKGHACAGLYAALAMRGFFSKERLAEFYTDGGTLAGHATHRGVPGVEVSTGSLGHGLALAVGFAKAAELASARWRTFALLSDGECDEGATWEAALLASAWGLSGLTVIVDYNKIQSLGRVDEVIPLEPFAEKWRAFGWFVVEVDGHDLKQLRAAIEPRGTRPTCVLAHTVKGKGVTFMEDSLLWHYRCPAGAELEAARQELGGPA